MADTAIRQAPGWWPSLVRVECDDYGYRGPVRNLNKNNEWGQKERQLREKARAHRCGEPDE